MRTQSAAIRITTQIILLVAVVGPSTHQMCHAGPLAPATDLDSLIALVQADSVQSYLNRLQAFNGRVAGTDSIYAARDWMGARFRSFGYDSVYNDSFSAPVSSGDRPCYNVVAVKPGTARPELQIVIGAHYDAVPGSPGADDNGSGSSGVLELARVLRDVPIDITVIFVTFDAHEWGVYGSAHYAQVAAARHDQILVMFNLDMIGNRLNSGDAWLLYGPDARYAQLWADSGGPRVGITGHPTVSTIDVDHYPFIQRGYNGVFVWEYAFSPVHHTSQDSTTYINFDYAARMIGATLATVCVIANSDWDADGIPNGLDNCPITYNPPQNDADADGLGDACDPCICLCHGDPQCDSVANVQDVVQTVNVAFRGVAPVFDPQCPRERTDVDCDGVSAVQDVVKVVNVAFRGADPGAELCNPCGM